MFSVKGGQIVPSSTGTPAHLTSSTFQHYPLWSQMEMVNEVASLQTVCEEEGTADASMSKSSEPQAKHNYC